MEAEFSLTQLFQLDKLFRGFWAAPDTASYQEWNLEKGTQRLMHMAVSSKEPRTRVLVLSVLWNSGATGAQRAVIANCPGVLQSLERFLLDSHETSELHEACIGILLLLSGVSDAIRRRIIDSGCADAITHFGLNLLAQPVQTTSQTFSITSGTLQKLCFSGYSGASAERLVLNFLVHAPQYARYRACMCAMWMLKRGTQSEALERAICQYVEGANVEALSKEDSSHIYSGYSFFLDPLGTHNSLAVRRAVTLAASVILMHSDPRSALLRHFIPPLYAHLGDADPLVASLALACVKHKCMTRGALSMSLKLQCLLMIDQSQVCRLPQDLQEVHARLK